MEQRRYLHRDQRLVLTLPNHQPTKAMEKCYSTNEEEFNHTSVDEAVSALLDDGILTAGQTATLWEADAVKRSASAYMPDVADAMEENASVQCGEYADDWDISGRLAESLREAVAKAVDQWATENNMHPHFWEVENVKPFSVRITDEDGGYEILHGEND